MRTTLNVYLIRICRESLVILLCFFFTFLDYKSASLHIPQND